MPPYNAIDMAWLTPDNGYPVCQLSIYESFIWYIWYTPEGLWWDCPQIASGTNSVVYRPKTAAESAALANSSIGNDQRSLPLTWINCDWGMIAEQITVRIVQIMMQATDLAQILYGGHFSRKESGPRKISIWPPFSKMAAMGFPEMLFFALNWQ